MGQTESIEMGPMRNEALVPEVSRGYDRMEQRRRGVGGMYDQYSTIRIALI